MKIIEELALKEARQKIYDARDTLHSKINDTIDKPTRREEALLVGMGSAYNEIKNGLKWIEALLEKP